MPQTKKYQSEEERREGKRKISAVYEERKRKDGFKAGPTSKRYKTAEERKEGTLRKWRLQNYKRVAKQFGRKWELTDDQANKLFLSACFYCGSTATPTLLNGIDRMDNDGDYVQGNVVPCCSKHNYMKKNLGMFEFVAECEKVAKHMKQAMLKLGE